MTSIPQTSTLYPVIKYRDVSAAIDILERAFGFQQWLIVPGPDGSVRHAGLAYRTSVAMLSSLGADDEWQQAGAGIGLYLANDDTDTHCEHARATGAELLMEPFDIDYGSRDDQARDPEGYSWYLGTFRPSRPSSTTG